MAERATAPITITAYDWVPPFAQGQVRDLRVRWALEEVEQDYAVRYLRQGEQKEPPHRARQPFGQVPTYEADGLTLFESGAIVLHVAQRFPGLLPEEDADRALAVEWMFAALNTVEPPITDYFIATLFESQQPWTKPRLALVEQRVTERLSEAAQRLGRNDWFAGDRFTAGDLLMVCVLRSLEGSDLLAPFPTLAAYVARGIARPAFARALAAQMAGFTGEPPAQWAEFQQKIAAQGE